MNFEGFQHLLVRIVRQWNDNARKEFKADFDSIHAYLQESPFTAKQTPENEEAYERLMDVRMKLYELSAEIDANHDAYMEFMQQTLDRPDLMQKVTRDLTVEEQHLVHLELMIMEQVADWEMGSGKVDSASQLSKPKLLVVHLPNGSTRTIAISQEANKRYWFAMCPISWRIGDLRTCSGCKVVGYVGKEEQREDWPRHKAVCKLLKTARGKSDLWVANHTSEELIDMLKAGLKRPLEQYEYDMAEHPRTCIVCGQGDDQSILRNCPNCFCVAFCGDHAANAKPKHVKYCEALKMAIEDYKNEVTLGHQVQSYSPAVCQTYKKLEADMEAFFAADVSCLVSTKIPGYLESELRYLTFLYTCPLTVLFGAEASDLKAGPIEQATSLVIHLLGVRRAELRHLTGWEIIACRLPKLKNLTLHFIGDESPCQDLPREFVYKGKEIQAGRQNLTIRYIFEKPMLYQSFVQQPSYTSPDIIVALDCGFKFYPSWRPALKYILKNSIGCPLIFTEFNLPDQVDNLGLLREMADLDVVLEPQKNPFCSKRPVRSCDKTGNYESHSVIYTNDFVCVVKSKGPK